MCLRVILYRATILCLAALTPVVGAAAQQRARSPLPEATGPTIEYASVAAALEGLRTKPGVVFTVEKGWAIATDEAAYTIWSFAPPTYGAYPAVVKRQVISRGAGSEIVMDIHCEASKSACDDLNRTFSELNGFELPN